jgi:outer membrane protein assembly complex protein YaeT
MIGSACWHRARRRPARFRLALAGLVAGVLAGPSAAGAQTQPPEPSEPRRVEVRDIRFTGVTAVRPREIAAVLATRKSGRWPWSTKYYYSRADLLDDVKRVRAFYADRGYPAARVVTYDVEDRDGGKGVAITFNVAEGEPIRLESIDSFGFDVLPRDALQILARQVEIRPGSVRTRESLEQARDLGQNALREAGYPYARVSVLESHGTAPGTVAVIFAAEPGETAIFGPVTIRGQRSIGEDVIRRQLAFGPGDPYKFSRVLESQRRLYKLELFDFVNFTTPNLETQPKEVPVTLNLTEGKHRRVQFGFGYGSEELARVSGRWRTANFFGGGRSASLEAKWSSLDRGVKTTFETPYFFSSSYRFGAQLQQWHSNEPAYTLLTRGGRASVSREIVRRDEYGRGRSATRAVLSLVDEYESYTITQEALDDPTFRDDLIALGLDPDTNEGRGTLVAVGLDLRHDTAGSLLDPKRGYVAALHVEQAWRVLGGDWQYTEAALEGRYYFNLGRRTVLATLARGAAIMAPGRVAPEDDPLNVRNPNVPFFKRYFLGGSNQLRGWGRYEVSPLNGSGFPIGGLARFETMAELRFPIRGPMTGVAFVEGGNVWPDVTDVEFGELVYDAGAGIRYQTPIGPIRFDFGYQLTPIEGLIIDGELQTRRWRLHFSVGQAF